MSSEWDDVYRSHFDGSLYDRPPAEGSFQGRRPAATGVMGGHSLESAPDLQSRASAQAAHLRAGVLERLRAAGRMVPNLDPAHFGAGPGLWLAHIEGSRVGGGLGGNLEGVEARFIGHRTDSNEAELVHAWGMFFQAALAERTYEGQQRQAEHDAEVAEMRAREEMNAARSAQAGAQFRQALDLGRGHGRR
jgi:hypothetical protein